MKTTNIYILIDPRDRQVRYIGKTNNPDERFKNHMNRGHNKLSYKRNWIESLKKLKLKPIMQIIDIVLIDEWIFWEKYWISQFKSWGFNLTNHTEGGDGCTFGNKTSFKKGHISWNKGTAKLKILKGTKGKEPNSVKYYFQKSHTPWNKYTKGIKLKKDKNVYQYSGLTGKFIKQWNTAKQASMELELNEESIGQCCRNKSRTCGGYIWKYSYFDYVPPVTFIGKTNNKIKNSLK